MHTMKHPDGDVWVVGNGDLSGQVKLCWNPKSGDEPATVSRSRYCLEPEKAETVIEVSLPGRVLLKACWAAFTNQIYGAMESVASDVIARVFKKK